MTTAVTTHQPWCDREAHDTDADISYCFGPALGDSGDTDINGWWLDDRFVVVNATGRQDYEIPREDVPALLALLQRAAAQRP